VAVCPGSGGSCLRAAIDAGCHAFVTGEMGYHDAQEAAESSMAVIAAGHYATERPIVPKLCELLAARLPGAKLVASTTITDPWHRPPG
jgi:putative NIF3 family GTP cyclohydrolase 1 type 2